MLIRCDDCKRKLSQNPEYPPIFIELPCNYERGFHDKELCGGCFENYTQIKGFKWVRTEDLLPDGTWKEHAISFEPKEPKAYLQMSVAEKVYEIERCGFHSEDAEACQNAYMDALLENSIECVKEYEALGEDPRHIIENMTSIRHWQQYGFKDFTYGSGWIKRPDFNNEHEISFKVSGIWENTITLASGPNGKWTHGISCGYYNGGSSYGYGFGDPYDNYTECVIAALNEMIERHSTHTERSDVNTKEKKACSSLVKLAKEKLYEMRNGKQQQLSLLAM